MSSEDVTEADVCRMDRAELAHEVEVLHRRVDGLERCLSRTSLLLAALAILHAMHVSWVVRHG